jgi:hypothetical protein
MQLDESRGEITERRRRGEGAVDKRPASALSRDVAADHELTTLGGLEDRLDCRLTLAGTDEILGRAGAQQQSDGLDKNGFARPGLTRQDVEAGLELDLNGLDDGEVAYAKETQHARGTSIVS